MAIPFIFFYLISGFTNNLFAFRTDTLKILSYNTCNYGFPATNSCPGLLTFKKHNYLREILQYERPDIIGLVKMAANPSSFSTDTIPDKVLDSVCAGCYSHTTFTNKSGYKKENMLYFRKDKLGYISSTTLYSGDKSISDINLHRLFYLAPDLSVTQDTQFINIILVHLLSGASSYTDRATEINGAMTYLQTHFPALKNYIFMGDFNTVSSYEQCYQDMVNPSDTGFRFHDPVNQPGYWEAQPNNFAIYLTQSTRLNAISDCGGSGGIGDRFDHILLSYPILQGTDSVKYIPGSFKVIGQDGKHIGNSIDTPSNVSAPAKIINDLYLMSNHLPVELKIAISTPAIKSGIATTNPFTKDGFKFSLIGTDNTFDIYIPDNCLPSTIFKMKISDITGKLIISSHFSAERTFKVQLPHYLTQGIYILHLNDEKEETFITKLFKP